MARVRLVKLGEEPDELKPVYAAMAKSRAALAEKMGVPPAELVTETWQIYGNAPKMMQAAYDYRCHVHDGSSLPKDLKEKIAFVAVNAQKCPL